MSAKSNKKSEQSLANAYNLVSSIDKLVERAHDSHLSLFKTFGDLSGVSTIRKDKSVTEGVYTDISSTLETMKNMIATIGKLEDQIGKLEKKPREKLISEDVQKVLKDYAPYIRLMAEQGDNSTEMVDSAIRQLDASAMRLQIGDFGEMLSKESLDSHLEALKEKYPKLEFAKQEVGKRGLLLNIRIPSIIQISLNMVQVHQEQYEVNAINVFSDEELGPNSKFHIFHRIAYDANIVWYSIAGFSVEHRLFKIMQWFSLFENLFSAKCSVCDRHLQMEPRASQYLPPLWREVDIKSNGPNRAFHYGCMSLV